MNIVLTGFMASGKSEISKKIAEISKYKQIDTDEIIEKNCGLTINEIFAKHGERTFREIEHNTICDISRLDGYVIATGGGVPLNESNISELRKNGIIINLAPDFEVIEQRLEAAKATRPLLQNRDIQEIRKRFNDRLPFYSNCDAQIKVINGRTPNSYAIEILDICENLKK